MSGDETLELAKYAGMLARAWLPTPTELVAVEDQLRARMAVVDDVGVSAQIVLVLASIEALRSAMCQRDAGRPYATMFDLAARFLACARST